MSKLTTDTLQSLAANHEPCPADHAFLQDHGIPTPVGRQLFNVIVADNDCSGAFAVPLRKDEGDVVNAAIYLPVTGGIYQQAFVPGAPLAGAFARFGDVREQVYVTVDVQTAAVLHYSTGQASIAALWAENLALACDYFAAKENAPTITLAMDGLDDALAMHGQPIYAATELAAQRGWPFVTSGASETFQANGTYFVAVTLATACKCLKVKRVAGLGSIGWLVTKHPNHLSEGQPPWIVKREAICINAAAASRGA